MTGPAVAPAPSVESSTVERLAFSIEEAAEATGLSVTMVRTLLATDRLGYTTAGSRIVISRRHLDDFLDSPPEKKVSRPGYRKGS